MYKNKERQVGAEAAGRGSRDSGGGLGRAVEGVQHGGGKELLATAVRGRLTTAVMMV